MKYKNYKSAIHNFTHSFISIDFLKSPRYAINVLIDLYNLQKEPKATFDFIKMTIEPDIIDSTSSRELLIDYQNWLPIHFENHKCDLTKLEELKTTISVDFDRVFIPPRMNDSIQFEVNATTIWKADGREANILQISQSELMRKTFLNNRIPEVN